MRRFFLLGVLVLISTIGPANAAIITYRFTANLNMVQIVSTGLPSDSYVAQGALLPAISGVISYNSSAKAQPGSSADTAVYQTPVTIALDQFSTANPPSPTNRLIIVNDPAGDGFFARDTVNASDPSPFLDAVWFRFGGAPDVFSNTNLPTHLTLSDFVFGSVTLVTHDTQLGSVAGFNYANFLMDTLTPANEIPVPAAWLLFATGFGSVFYKRRGPIRLVNPSLPPGRASRPVPRPR